MKPLISNVLQYTVKNTLFRVDCIFNWFKYLLREGAVAVEVFNQYHLNLQQQLVLPTDACVYICACIYAYVCVCLCSWYIQSPQRHVQCAWSKSRSRGLRQSLEELLLRLAAHARQGPSTVARQSKDKGGHVAETWYCN